MHYRYEIMSVYSQYQDTFSLQRCQAKQCSQDGDLHLRSWRSCLTCLILFICLVVLTAHEEVRGKEGYAI